MVGLLTKGNERLRAGGRWGMERGEGLTLYLVRKLLQMIILFVRWLDNFKMMYYKVPYVLFFGWGQRM